MQDSTICENIWQCMNNILKGVPWHPTLHSPSGLPDQFHQAWYGNFSCTFFKFAKCSLSFCLDPNTFTFYLLCVCTLWPYESVFFLHDLYPGSTFRFSFTWNFYFHFLFYSFTAHFHFLLCLYPNKFCFENLNPSPLSGDRLSGLCATFCSSGLLMIKIFVNKSNDNHD